MTFAVRGRYRLEPGQPLALVRSDDITQAEIDKTRESSEEAALRLDEVRLSLGQGSARGDRFEETDERCVGELRYPSDFADFKLKADVMLRGTCYPPRKTDVECEVSFQVGSWKKSLRVVGHRVWVDHVAGGEHTEPRPIGSVAVDYAHAYGGPGFTNNPVGKGHVEMPDGDGEDLYQPPRSERSAVMPSQQLPNILYSNGRALQGGVPAGFGPLSPYWGLRSGKLGKKYDQEWLDTRAPYFAEDMDGSYFNAAPPDQQIEGYLRGDEELTFTNLHPQRRRFSVTLPGERVRVFVRDTDNQCREIPMQLDTLFADLDEGSLYLTWRGITQVKEEDLTDVEYGLVVTEPLAEAPRPAAGYIEQLESFAADPIGLKEAFPEGFMEFADNAEKLEDASDEELDALLENDDGNSPPVAVFKNVFGPMAPPGLEVIDSAWAKATEQEGVDAAALKAQVGAATKTSMRGGGGDGGVVGMRIPVRAGEDPIFPIGNIFREQEKNLLAMKKKLPDHAASEAGAKIDAALEKIRTNPKLLAADPHYRPYQEDDPPPDEPGPGADLLGRDLSDMDLSGMDLSGADIQCAILSRTNLRGANLRGAKLGGARLNRVDLSEANLTDVDLTSASFDRVTATRANLTRARLDMLRASKSDFREAFFSESEGMLATLTKCAFERSDFSGAQLMMCSFDACALPTASFRRAKLEHVRFDGCEAPGIVLDRAELVGASFNECQLPEASVSGVSGDGAIWFKSNLHKASFHKADLTASHFYSINALEADFSRANVPSARFDRAILRAASFERANLFSADLRKAVLTKTNFMKATLHDAKLTETVGADVGFDGANTKGMNVQRSKITTTRGATK
ncbi:MAG: DUF2169 domain-containing protein [Deltaproteobacteria bacterium]|jgi:uncharacterized protein YjbI with pentapeptide repeats|nr:DUF2169 domain-containing protein [Deltaproteobacteria bacterium]